MNKHFPFFVLLGVLMTVSQALEAFNIEQNIDQTENVTTYKVSKVIDLKNSEQNHIEFYISYMAYSQGCTKAHCFHGWLENSTLDGAETIQGFPKGNASPQPVFKFRTNSESDFEIETPKYLNTEWKQLIQITCEKMNPKILEEGSLPEERQGSSGSSLSPKYKFETAESSKVHVPSEMNLSSRDYYHNSSKNIKLENINTTKSHVNESIAVDSHKRVKHRITNYTFSIPSDNASVSDKGEPIEGNASTVIKLEESLPASDYASELQKVKALLSDSSNLEVLNASQISRQRQAVRNDPTITHVRIVPRKEESLVKRQNVKKLNINIGELLAKVEKQEGNVNQGKISASNAKGVKNLQAQFIEQTATKRSLQVEESETGKSSYRPIRRLESFSEEQESLDQWFKQFQIENNEIPESTSQAQIQDTHSTLISKSILGHTYTLEFDQHCVLKTDTYHNGTENHTVKCVGNAISSFGSNSQTVQVYDFQSGVDETWDWSKRIGHNLKFGFTIPLPPPVEFIQLHFEFQLQFMAGITLNAYCNATDDSSDLYFNVVPAAEVDAYIDAKFSVRVAVAEGGVEVHGQLIGLDTSPKFTLDYNFPLKQVDVNFDWTASLKACTMSLSFFAGAGALFWWHDWTIKSWTLTGGFQDSWSLVNYNAIIHL